MLSHRKGIFGEKRTRNIMILPSFFTDIRVMLFQIHHLIALNHLQKGNIFPIQSADKFNMKQGKSAL